MTPEQYHHDVQRIQKVLSHPQSALEEEPGECTVMIGLKLHSLEEMNVNKLAKYF